MIPEHFFIVTVTLEVTTVLGIFAGMYGEEKRRFGKKEK